MFWVRWFRGLGDSGHPPLRQYAQSGMCGQCQCQCAFIGPVLDQASLARMVPAPTWPAQVSHGVDHRGSGQCCSPRGCITRCGCLTYSVPVRGERNMLQS